MPSLLLWKIIEYYTTGVCAFVAFGFHHALRMRHIFICGLPRSAVYLYIFPQTARFSKNKITENKMCVLIFSTFV
jgi:hypothetical protein